MSKREKRDQVIASAAERPRVSPRLRFDPQSPSWIGLRLMVVANRYLQPLYAELERRHGLLRDDAAVIACLSITNAATAQQIARYTGRPKNSISRSVTTLEGRELLIRSAHPEDGRAANLALTPAGRRVFNDIRNDFSERDARLLDGLTKEEQRLFSRLLTTISEASADWR